MNLQIVSPYTPCPYQCPYCVSNFEGAYRFFDLYHQDRTLYMERLFGVLTDALQNGEPFLGAVLTGLTDPSLFPEWIDDVMSVLKEYQKSQPLNEIVLQTSNLMYIDRHQTDVMAFSIGNRKKIDLLPSADSVHNIMRLNMMLSDDLTFEDILHIIEKVPNAQYTVKYLALTSHGHGKTDEWIKEHRRELTPKEENTLLDLGVWIDKACMDAEGRYRVFREDGFLYQSWTDTINDEYTLFSSAKEGVLSASNF